MGALLGTTIAISDSCVLETNAVPHLPGGVANSDI